VANDLSWGGDEITINSDGVDIDFNGHFVENTYIGQKKNIKLANGRFCTIKSTPGVSNLVIDGLQAQAGCNTYDSECPDGGIIDLNGSGSDANICVLNTLASRIHLNNAHNSLISNCKVIGCGVKIDNSDCVTVKDTESYDNGDVTEPHGFWAINSNQITFINDIACTNTGSGFKLEDTTNSIIRGCLSEDNSVYGFAIIDYGATSENNVICESKATNNGSNGFHLTANFTNGFLSNYACNNTNNYNIATSTVSAPISSLADARGVDNVDCTLADLDKVCVVDSKIDALGDDIDDDFRGTWTQLEFIRSKVGVVETKVDMSNANHGTSHDKLDISIAKHILTQSAVELLESKVCVIETKVDGHSAGSSANHATTHSLLDIVESKVCVVETKLDDLGDDIDLDFLGTWTQLEVLESKLCALDVKVTDLAFDIDEDFRGTWTQLDGLCSKIENVEFLIGSLIDNLL